MDIKDLGRSVKEVEQREAGLKRGLVYELDPGIVLVSWVFPRPIPTCNLDKVLGKSIAELRENIQMGRIPVVLYLLTSDIVKPN